MICELEIQQRVHWLAAGNVLGIDGYDVLRWWEVRVIVLNSTEHI